MNIGGFQKTTLLDYPKEVSAIIWTVGCNFRCPFCYNTDLVNGTIDLIPESEVIAYLQKRKNLLTGLVISGGEPFLQKDIAVFCQTVKNLGYRIKIDTNGTFPDEMKDLLDKRLVDYIAMDVKAPKDKYETLSGHNVDLKQIQRSIDIIRGSHVDYEFKTTFVPGLLDKEDIVQIGRWLKGSKKYYLQQFKSDTPTLSADLQDTGSYPKEELLAVIEEVKPFFKQCYVRGL